MKISILHIFFCTILGTTLAAQHNPQEGNIIPNPGFEQYASTPIGWFYKGSHFTSVMKYWFSATTASPDVFGPKVRVPTQWAARGFGQQRAKSGKSMVGITVYGCENGKPHCREYIEIQLKEPLVPGQTYYASFWTTRLPRSLGINNLGMHFSQKRLQANTDRTLDVIPQVLSKDIKRSPAGKWIQITGEFTATTEAEFLTIGNFFTDSLSTINRTFANQLNFAYYYIDDVVVRKTEPILPVPVKADDLTNIAIEEGITVTLKDIFFDTDKAELLPRSFVELRKLVLLMKKHSTMVIEIAGHTDDQGSDRYNMALSRKRARAVVDFLADNGVARDRIRYQGFGATHPIASNDTEAGRQLNRRVTFFVIRK